MKTTRTYKLIQSHPATPDGNFGAVRTVDTETITAVEGGLRVDTHVTGHVEGKRVDQRVSKFYPNVSLEAAHAWRLAHGYVEV